MTALDAGRLVDRLRTAALLYASRGWHVFPLLPGQKRPACPGHPASRCDRSDPWCRRGHTGWEQRATTSDPRIRRAWSSTPYGIGIACGPSRLLVVDTDQPKPGDQADVAGPTGEDSLARAVIVTMRRRAPDEQVQPFRVRRDGPALHLLKARLNRWVRGQLDQLAVAEPAMPVEDRTADTWEPLVAVADAAGGHWTNTARNALLAMTGDDVTAAQVSLKVRLLIDCRTALGDAAGLPTATLLDRLRGDDEAPWIGLGKVGLTAASLAGMLGEFGISSGNRRWPDSSQTKGYLAADFIDSWARYCPPTRTGAHPFPAVPPSHTPESGTASTPWDGNAVPDTLSRPNLTPVGRRDGWDGTPASTPPAVCITCRNPLSYDDGTHTHPTCETTTNGRN